MKIMSSKPSDYEVEKKIGSGSFRTVYLVRNRTNTKDGVYVIKEVDLTQIEEPTMRQRVLEMATKEAESVKLLDCRNIVKVFDHFTGIRPDFPKPSIFNLSLLKQDGNIFRLSMEYCGAGTLKQAIIARQGTPFPEEEIRGWMAQLVVAIKYLHTEKKILHGDIRSGNIFLGSGGHTVKLGNFGMAKALSAAFMAGQTAVIPAITHAPPEMFKLPANPNDPLPSYNFKSEVWALGVVIYELMALKLPFTGEHVACIIAKIQNLPPKALPSTFSDELRELVEMRLLNKDPGRRPNISEIIDVSTISRALSPSGLECSLNSTTLTTTPIDFHTTFQELLSAAENGDLKLINEILANSDRKLVIDLVTLKNDTPLHRAASRDQVEALELFWPYVNELAEWRNSSRMAAIHVGVENRSYRAVQFLAGKQKSLLQLKGGDYGMTPLHFAVQIGDLEMASLLVGLGADIKAHSDRVDPNHVPTMYKPSLNRDNAEKWSTPIHLAAYTGHLNIVQMLEKAIEISLDPKGTHPIHSAAIGGQIEVADHFLKSGVNIEIRESNFGRTILHLASERGHLSLVEALVKRHKACTFVASNPEDYEMTPIHLAAYCGHLNVVDFYLKMHPCLLHAKDNQGNGPVHWAAFGGHTDVVENLFQRGVKVEFCNDFGATPLLCAAQNGHVELVKFLAVKCKANAYAKTNEGELAIHAAASHGQLAVIDYLLGTDPSLLHAENGIGEKPIHKAALGGHTKAVEYFILQKEISVDLPQEDYGRTALHCAADRGHLELAKILIEKHKANMYAKDNSGNLPIHIAALAGHMQLVEYFVSERGLSVDLGQDSHGYTPLHFAAAEGHLELVKILSTKLKANIYAKDAQGGLPIHSAALCGQIGVVEYFISQHGMNVDLPQDTLGRTPLHLAADQGHVELVKLLTTKYKADAFQKSNREDDEMLPIHIAAWQGRLEVVKFFIQEFPDLVNVKTSSGKTALKLATESGTLNEAPRVAAYLVQTIKELK